MHLKNIAGLAPLMGLLLLAGCENDDEREQQGAPAMSEVAPVPRPEALETAIKEIKAGKPADAQPKLEAFLQENPKHIYRAECHYLLGQAQAAQGQYEPAKKNLDKAVDGTDERTLKSLAMLGRADCNMAMEKFQLASRQYHWLETMYRDVKAIPQDELLFKLGLSTKKAGADETADHWFKQVIELYATSPYAAQAKQYHTQYAPADPEKKPLVYSLEVSSYSNKEKAESEAASLRMKQFRDVEVISTTRNGLPTYEVHIGKFENKNDAMRAQTDAQLAGLPTTIRPAIVEPLK